MQHKTSKTPEGPLIVPPVHIGKECEIAKDSQVGPYAVLGDGCRIRSGAVVENSILWEGVPLGSRATVQNSIIGISVENGEQIMDTSRAANPG